MHHSKDCSDLAGGEGKAIPDLERKEGILGTRAARKKQSRVFMVLVAFPMPFSVECHVSRTSFNYRIRNHLAQRGF